MATCLRAAPERLGWRAVHVTLYARSPEYVKAYKAKWAKDRLANDPEYGAKQRAASKRFYDRRMATEEGRQALAAKSRRYRKGDAVQTTDAQ